MAESELDRAAREYASQASPFAGLQNFLLNRPVFDRGPAPTPTTPTLRTLDFVDDPAQNQAANFRDLIQRQETTQREEREAALQSLREALQEETSSSLAAQAAERSEVVKALEDRLAGVKESIATESEALREQGLQERADIRAQQQAAVDQLQQNIDTAKAELAASQQQVAEAQTTALGDLEDRQSSLIGDLTTRISGLNDDLGTIQAEIRADLAEQQATLSDDQKAAADLLQQRIDALNSDLSAVGESVQTETAAQTELLRGEREQLVSQLENQIGTLKDQVGALPLDEIQSRIDDITSQSQDFVQTATTERAELAQQIAALEAAGVTQQDLEAALQGAATAEDLESLRGDYQATGRLVEEALQTGQRQREGLQERVQALKAAQLDPASIQQQRATEIQAAVDPISQQIEALQGQIPQQIDVEALRKQITDDIMGRMPTAPTVAPNVSAGVGAGGEPFTGGSVGSTYEPERGVYGVMPTTEGAAEMGATPYFDNYQGRGGTRPAAPVAAPPVGVAPPPQIAATTPAPAAPPAVEGIAGIPQQTLFDPMSLRFPNMRMR